MSKSEVYVEPRVVEEMSQCYFYHTMDLPGHGTTDGEWDLRPGLEDYLGGVSFDGKRVLEIGTASGCCCFWMEKQGAEVVAYDLSPDHSWDVVPFARQDSRQIVAERKARMEEINNAYWLAHRSYGSKARVVYGNVYGVPREIGCVDIATLCLVLPHVRDPFLALQNALRLTRETAIVVGSPQSKPSKRLLLRVLRRYLRPGMYLWPDPVSCTPWDTWWMIPEDTIKRFLEILGFEDISVNYHYQTTRVGKRLLFTVVGKRVSGECLAD